MAMWKNLKDDLRSAYTGEFELRLRLMLYASIVAPIWIFILGVVHVWQSSFRINVMGAYLALFIAGIYLSGFLYRRFRGLEAVFFKVRIGPDSDEGDVITVEWTALACVLGFMVFATDLDLLKLFAS